MDKPAQRLPKGRIIALDYGLARIGVAVSDETKLIASPLMTITTERKSEYTIAKILKELAIHQETLHYQIEEIVIGLPLMMSGKSGLVADEVKHFAELFRKSVAFPIVLWDERLTTVQAERALRESSLTRKKRSQVVDKVAAVIILQSYLDSKFFLKN